MSLSPKNKLGLRFRSSRGRRVEAAIKRVERWGSGVYYPLARTMVGPPAHLSELACAEIRVRGVRGGRGTFIGAQCGPP